MKYSVSNLLHQMRSIPQRIAIIDGALSYSNRDIDIASDHLALYLHDTLEPGNCYLPILGERSVNYIVAVLAGWKLGLTVVPLGKQIPAERLQHILKELNCPQVLCNENATLPTDSNAKAINWQLSLSSFGQQAPFECQDSDKDAYIIFTSGTTGKPKGCRIGFESLLPITESFVNYYGIDANSRMTFAANTAFDAAMMECLPALFSGATLHIVPQSTLMNITALVNYYHQFQITFSWLPTTIAEVLMSQPELVLPDNLKTIQVAGQRLNKRPPKQWHTKVENAYGPTETTVITTSGEVLPEGTSRPHIGKPLPGVILKIVDQEDNELPPGKQGELCIAGIGVSRGYINSDFQHIRTLKTASQSNEVYYFSGDICFRDDDGNIHFVGRKDRQLKIGGYRVEPGEIEYLLNDFPAVVQSYVTAQIVQNRSVIIAYLVTKNELAIPRSEILQFLSQRLPHYMLPDYFELLRELPVNANGKIDESMLPLVQLDSSNVEVETTTPLTEANNQFLKIFKKHLGKQVGWQSNFFNAGGTSIIAITLIAELQSELGIALSYEHFTREGIIADIYGAAKNNSNTLVTISPRSDKNAPIALSASQKAIWFLANLDIEDRAYHAKATLELHGELDKKAVYQSLQLILDRHEIFRTSFHQSNNLGEQRVHQDLTLELPTYDYSHLTPAKAEAELEELIQETINKTFNLAEAPLVRWALVTLANNKHVLIHIEHHLVHDGWSYNIFLDDFAQAYQYFTRSAPLNLPEHMQYGDFCIRQHAWLNTPDASKQLAFWRDNLKGAENHRLQLPQQGDPNAEAVEGDTLRIQFPRATWGKLEKVAAQRSETLFSLVLTAFSLAMFRYSGSTDINIGSAFANRNWINADKIIGMMINTVVLRVRLQPDISLDDLCAECFAVVANAQANQELPFENVVNALQPSREKGVNPLFQVFMGFHDSTMPDLDLPGIQNTEVFEAIGSKAAKFDLSMVVIPRKGQRGNDDPVHILMEYKTAKFSPWFIEQLAGSITTVLTQIAQSQSKLVAEVLRPNAVINGDSLDHDGGTFICTMLQNAESWPHRTALISGNNMTTYAELCRNVKAKCQYLQAQGVENECLVGVMLPREASLLEWLLAIQLSGATYIPIDPEYPRSRIDYIVEYSKLSHLVSAQSPCCDATWINMDSSGDAEQFKAQDIDSSSAMYVIYTSGSTGKPKGVVINHAAFNNFITSMALSFPLSEANNWLSVTSASFDISTLEFYLPLLQGATIVLATNEEVSDPLKLASALQSHNITHMQATPSGWRGLADSPWQAPENFTALCGGEALPQSLAIALLNKNLQLYNMYGPTETSVWSSLKLITKDNMLRPSIGKPIHNTQMWILDENKHPLPPGAKGDLWIGGDGLADGYLHQPEKTKERFQYIPAAGVRAYKTGDLASITEHDELLFHGRDDFQIKLNGHRIELGEIENTLTSIAGVNAAVVLLREKAGFSNLVAFVEEENDSTDHLLKACQQRLPGYMVPAFFQCMKTLPKTPNGKLDRNQLPDIDIETNVLRAPETETEVRVAEVYKEFLGLTHIDASEGFFKMGGQSLMAMQIVMRLSNEFGIQISVIDLLHLSSVENMAAFIDSLSAEQDGAFEEEITF